jgi:hypothetical protein
MSRVTALAKPRAGNAHGQTDDDADLAIKRAHTTVAQAGVHKPAGVAASVFEAGQMAKPPRVRRKLDRAEIDIDALVIMPGTPASMRRPGTGRTEEFMRLAGRLPDDHFALLEPRQAKVLRDIAGKQGFKVKLQAHETGKVCLWITQRPQANKVGGDHAA